MEHETPLGEEEEDEAAADQQADTPARIPESSA
jgi:hypothetical protein